MQENEVKQIFAYEIEQTKKAFENHGSSFNFGGWGSSGDIMSIYTSLPTKGNKKLIQSLIEVGWDIERTEKIVDFRNPYTEYAGYQMRTRMRLNKKVN